MIEVLGSGSKGNCYILTAGNEKLILDCGINLLEIKKELNFDLSNVVGCLLTHSHKDHSLSVKGIASTGMDVYSLNEIFEECKSNNHRLKKVIANKVFKVGNFKIIPFEVNHTHNDRSYCPTLGFLIKHPAIGKVLYATDTYYLNYKFDNVDHILIECNYSEEVLDTIPDYRARVLKSHMSLENLKEALKTWDLRNTKDITLIHLSNENGDPEKFKNEIQALTGIKTYIAAKGLKI